MATYKVQPNQNIFDISLQLYGTIEGIFDLLISNSWLTMNTDLVTGQELEYHEGYELSQAIVNGLADDGIVPSNGERHVYIKQPTELLLAVCVVDESYPVTSFVIGGEGEMIVDWGDNSELEVIQLSHSNQRITHYFDNTVDSRRLRIYGNTDTLKLTYWDTTDINGTLFMTRPLVVDEYVSQSNGYSLSGLFLFKDTYHVDLQKCTISNLLPIGDMYLQELNLLNVHFTSVSVLDEYLNYIFQCYGDRQGCTVYLDTAPSEDGIAIIAAILAEPEWNDPIPWKFIINGETFTL